MGNGAAHIERIDCLMKFDSDDEAAEYAERVEGVKLIHDIAFPVGNSNYAQYLDTLLLWRWRYRMRQNGGIIWLQYHIIDPWSS